MAEKKFTKYFKLGLKDRINEFFEDKGVPLYAVTEFGKGELYASDFCEETVVDIGILPVNVDRNVNFRFVAIEIEYISSVEQIFLNFGKLLNYAKRHKRSKVGLLHLIFWESQITKTALVEIAKLPLVANGNGNGKFYYQLFLCDETLDKRRPKACAEEIFKNWKFGARLFSLLEVVFGRYTFSTQRLVKNFEWW